MWGREWVHLSCTSSRLAHGMRRATRWFVVRLDPMPLSPMSPVAPLTHATPLALSLAPPPAPVCALGLGSWDR